MWAWIDIIDKDELCSTKEEADIRLILHTINCNYKYIFVSSRDTDVIAPLVSHFHRMKCIELWMMRQTETQSMYIPIHDLVTNISANSLKAPIPFYTLAGSDKTSF